jgi:rRNA small subunit pseudouridine methyltransferase Nep1
MKRLGVSGSKRGRPDIVHSTLLTILGSPLDRERLLDVFVHTWEDYVIRVSPDARLPRNYDRFLGLIEQLYETKVVPPEGERLLELRVQTLHALLDELRPDRTVAFSTLGKSRSIRSVFAEAMPDRTAVLIGGFPRGHLRSEHERLAGELVAVDREAIDAWVIAGRVVYEFECAIGLDKKRLE